MTPDTLISVGRIARSRGLRGEVVVYPMSDDPDRFATFETVVVTSDDGSTTTRKILSAAMRPKQGRVEVHILFEGVVSREEADALKGSLLSVERDKLTLADDEYFLFDLAGLEVTDADGESLGRIKDVERLPGQDVIIVARHDGGEWLIPDVPEFVDKSELDDGKIKVTPIEGLLAD